MSTLVAESDFLAAVRDLATLHGWRLFHAHDSRRSPAGFPDLVLVRGERLLAIECKRQDGRLTPEQMAWLTDLGRVPGVEVAVWRPDDIDAIQEALR